MRSTTGLQEIKLSSNEENHDQAEKAGIRAAGNCKSEIWILSSDKQAPPNSLKISDASVTYKEVWKLSVQQLGPQKTQLLVSIDGNQASTTSKTKQNRQFWWNYEWDKKSLCLMGQADLDESRDIPITYSMHTHLFSQRQTQWENWENEFPFLKSVFKFKHFRQDSIKNFNLIFVPAKPI